MIITVVQLAMVRTIFVIPTFASLPEHTLEATAQSLQIATTVEKTAPPSFVLCACPYTIVKITTFLP
jgi:hypothetical protein